MVGSALVVTIIAQALFVFASRVIASSRRSVVLERVLCSAMTALAGQTNLTGSHP